MAAELRKRGSTKQPPSDLRQAETVEEQVPPEITLSISCQAVIALILVIAIAVLIFTIMTYAETRALRHDLLEPPTNATELRAAHSAMDVATQVFRRKKQFIMQ